MYSVYVIGKICCLVKPVFNIQCIKLNFLLGLLKPRNGFQGHKGTYIHTYMFFIWSLIKKFKNFLKYPPPPPEIHTHFIIAERYTMYL